MTEKKNFHMTPEEFRKQGYKVVDWVADYIANVEKYPVLSQVKPGEIRSKLPEAAPEKGEDFDQVMKDVNDIIMPGITHWQSPNFYAYFPCNHSGPSILADLLISGLEVQGMLWQTSPACTELETHVCDWLVDAMELPAHFRSDKCGGGIIQDSASSAALVAVIAAREKMTGCASNITGLNGNLVAYTSSQTHSSVEKAIKIAGIGSENLRKLEVDENYAVKPGHLEQLIKEDISMGRIPFFVCACIGTTSSNAIDPISEIGDICRKYKLWLHVDAAMSGSAAVCPQYRWVNKGIEKASSYCFNPHKWLFTNFDCNLFWVSDKAALINSLSILPEYLKNKATESGAVIDYRDWQISLGRRFRAIKLWFVLRHYGLEGLRYHVDQHVKIAQDFAVWVAESSDFELIGRPPLNLICFRYKGDDEKNMALMNRLNESGDIFLTHTKLNDQVVLRMSIGSIYTQRQHVENAWELIQAATKGL